jgi:hypothetical protein
LVSAHGKFTAGKGPPPVSNAVLLVSNENYRKSGPLPRSHLPPQIMEPSTPQKPKPHTVSLARRKSYYPRQASSETDHQHRRYLFFPLHLSFLLNYHVTYLSSLLQSASRLLKPPEAAEKNTVSSTANNHPPILRTTPEQQSSSDISPHRKYRFPTSTLRIEVYRILPTRIDIVLRSLTLRLNSKDFVLLFM